MKKSHSKTGRAVAVGCSALLGVMSDSVCSSLTKELIPSRLRCCEKWTSLTGDTAELLLYRLPKALPATRRLKNSGFPVVVVVLTSKVDRAHNEEKLQPTAAPSQNQRRHHSHTKDKSLVAEPLTLAGKRRCSSVVSNFRRSYTRHSGMILTPNESSSPTATENSPATPDNPKI